jgi:hypothetical protein
MAVEQVTSTGSKTLRSEEQITIAMRKIEESLNQLRSSHTEAQRFDMTFVWDVLIALTIFCLTVGFFIAHLPFVGDPWVLLIGPIAGLILALKHRPPR